MPTNDSDNMTCDQCQDAISAMADGEDPGVLPGDVDGHLAGCTRCRAFREAVGRSRSGFNLLGSI
jgi:predicted anti-sigma-YlaC factor YlaD